MDPSKISLYLFWPASRSRFFEFIFAGFLGKHGSTFSLPDAKLKAASASDLMHDIGN